LLKEKESLCATSIARTFIIHIRPRKYIKFSTRNLLKTLLTMIIKNRVICNFRKRL